jgi:hypothetical protein
MEKKMKYKDSMSLLNFSQANPDHHFSAVPQLMRQTDSIGKHYFREEREKRTGKNRKSKKNSIPSPFCTSKSWPLNERETCRTGTKKRTVVGATEHNRRRMRQTDCEQQQKQ